MRYSENDVSSAALDLPVYGGIPKKYFICTSPRSGSYLLCRHLIYAGLGIPHEYFNPINARAIGARFGVKDALGQGLEQYIRNLLARRTAGGVFGAKLQYWQYHDFLMSPPAAPDFLSHSDFIYLIREDLLAQAISYHFARLTGEWGFDGTVTTEKWDGKFDDLDAIDRQVETLIREEQGWRSFFAQNGISPLVITYELLCRRPADILLAIGTHCRVPTEQLRLGYREPRGEVAASSVSASKRDIYKAYVKARGSLVTQR